MNDVVETFTEFMAAFGTAQKAADDDARGKHMHEALDRIAVALAGVIEQFPNEKQALRQLMWGVTTELAFEDPYDRTDELDEECDSLKVALHEIRIAIRKGDAEWAIELVGREIGY